MDAYTLVIGNKNYSSWSLRPWLAMTQAGIPFTEHFVRLFHGDWRAELAKVSPTVKVPVLLHGDVAVWESLAILDYLADRHPDKGLWPADDAARAMARSAAAEMHAGFTALRNLMPMNLRRDDLKGRGRGPGLDKDVDRVTALWRECRERFGAGGPFLFGAFTNADAMFAPVVTRLDTYGVDLDPVCAEYSQAVLTMPAFKQWKAAALEEPWIIDEDEID